VQTLETQLAADRFQRIKAPQIWRATGATLRDLRWQTRPIQDRRRMVDSWAARIFSWPVRNGNAALPQLIEAFSRGAVPILEHPEFLDPPLQHNVNCLVFHVPDELVNVMEHAFHPDRTRSADCARAPMSIIRLISRPAALRNVPQPATFAGRRVADAYRIPRGV